MNPSSFQPRRPRGEEDLRSPYPLPPALARLPADGSARPQDFLAQNQRDRILIGALEVFGTKGFARASVADLTKAAGVSRATFYKSFGDKEECFAALHDEVLGWLEEEGRAVAVAAPDWPTAVLAVCESVVGVLGEDPRLARVSAIESLLAGPEVLARYEAVLGRLAVALDKGREERGWGKGLPQILEQALLAGAVALVSRVIVFHHDGSPSTLGSELAEMILIFYLGADEARRVVGRGI